MARKYNTPVGDRLKESAQRAGLTAEQIGDKLDATAGAVYAWWSGRNQPNIETLSEYARLTGTSLSYLAHGGSPSAEEEDRLVELVMRFADRLSLGETPQKSIDQALDKEAALTKREARSLDRRAEALRDNIRRLSGGDWWVLTAEQRRELATRLIQEFDE